jgi:hypothetical protein
VFRGGCPRALKRHDHQQQDQQESAHCPRILVNAPSRKPRRGVLTLHLLQAFQCLT